MSSFLWCHSLQARKPTDIYIYYFSHNHLTGKISRLMEIFIMYQYVYLMAVFSQFILQITQELTEWLVSFTTFPWRERIMAFLDSWEPYFNILFTQKQAYLDWSMAGTWGTSSSVIAARKSGVPIFSSHWITRDKSWEYTTYEKN
jgi:uncharacterized membrane protein YcgQ (UPF0703/DUF1980 family)